MFAAKYYIFSSVGEDALFKFCFAKNDDPIDVISAEYEEVIKIII